MTADIVEDNLLNICYAKTSKNEAANLAPELENFSMSEPEILEAILFRMLNRWTPEEQAYYKSHLGYDPCIMDKDQTLDFSAPASLIRKYLKLHKQDQKRFPSPFEFDRLNNLCDEILAQGEFKKPSKTPKTPKIVPQQRTPPIEPQSLTPPNLYVNHISTLPSLTGGIQYKKGTILGAPILPDTGSTKSILCMSLLTRLGLTEQDVIKDNIYNINTCNNQSKSIGTIRLNIYLKGVHNEFFKLEENFIVLEGNMLDKVILGCELLRSQCGEWKLFEDRETLTLNVFNKKGKQVRRKFCTLPPNSSVPLQPYVPNEPLPKSCFKTQFFSESFPNVENCHLATDDSSIGLQPLETFSINNESCQYNLLLSPDQWPIKSMFIYSTKIFKSQPEDCHNVTLSLERNVLCDEQLDVYAAEQCLEQSQAELFGQTYDKLLNLVAFPDLSTRDGRKGKSSTADSTYQNTKSAPPQNLPDLRHLPDDVRPSYEALFTRYASVFSTHKFDVKQANIAPIMIEYDRANPVCQPVRRFGPDENELIESYLKELLSAGIIRRRSNSTRWNSNLVLVPANAEASKRIRTTLSDNISREERLAALRKSTRPCLDLRSVNLRIKSPFGTLSLPSFEQLLPGFRNKLLSTTDCTKGYFSIPIHEDSQEIFSFRFKDHCYCFARLAMGFSQAGNIYQECMSRIISETDYEKYRKDIPELKDLSYRDAVSLFLDDISLTSEINYRQHYYLWEFLLIQCQVYNISLSPSKTVVASFSAEILGILVNTQYNTYSITPDRAEYFRKMNPPTSRQHIISQLSLFNYFRGLVPSLKLLSTNLAVAAKQKGCVDILPLHHKEFRMIQSTVAFMSSIKVFYSQFEF